MGKVRCAPRWTPHGSWEQWKTKTEAVHQRWLPEHQRWLPEHRPPNRLIIWHEVALHRWWTRRRVRHCCRYRSPSDSSSRAAGRCPRRRPISPAQNTPVSDTSTHSTCVITNFFVIGGVRRCGLRREGGAGGRVRAWKANRGCLKNSNNYLKLSKHKPCSY